MGLFDAFVENRASASTVARLSQTGEFWNYLYGAESASGVTVNRANAMRVGMVATCIMTIANAFASLPLKLKKKENGKKIDAVDHPLFNLAKLSPNPEMNSFSWRRSAQASVLSDGNCYAYIQRRNKGVDSLWPIPSTAVTPVRRGENGLTTALGGNRNNIIYDVKLSGDKTYRLPARDVLHITGFGFNGLQGESVVTSYARDLVGNGISLQDFEGAFFQNGMHIQGTLEHPETLGENKEKFVAALKQRYSGVNNVATPMVLENGMKYNAFKVSLVDQQFIELLELNDLQICRVFLIPPTIVGIEGVNESNNSLENENKRFLDTTLMPYIANWEQTLDLRLLTEQERKDGYFFKFNFDALLRPDAKTRSEINRIEWEHGVPLNVLRQRDDLDPIEGGDTSFVPMNFIPVDQAGLPNKQNQQDEDSGAEVVRHKEERSIKSRDAVAKVWEPVLRRSIDRMVTLETRAVEKKTIKSQKQRAAGPLKTWIDEFYEDFEGKVISDVGTVLRSFMEQLKDEINKEIGSPTISDAEFDGMANDFITGFAAQWAGSSRGQLNKLINESEDFYEEILTRVGEWQETKTEKRTTDTVNAAPNGVAIFVFASAGLGAIWRTRGAYTCNFCKRMSGKRVSLAGTPFLEGGTEIDAGDGSTPMLIRHTTKFPPMHRKCDCYVVSG